MCWQVNFLSFYEIRGYICRFRYDMLTSLSIVASWVMFDRAEWQSFSRILTFFVGEERLIGVATSVGCHVNIIKTV